MNVLKNIPVITENDDLDGKRVFLRVDFNVTLDDEGNVIDDYRIRKARPTIDYLRKRGASVIIASHMKHKKELVSLAGVSEYFQDEVPHIFVKNYDEVVDALKEESVVLLENLRFNEGEEKNDQEFAKKLADMADIYVNDAFAVSHREHASVVGITKYLPSYLGLLMTDEIENLSRAFNPEHPFVFILGGAKFETKLPLIEKFLEKADIVFMGGALANDLLKAKGFEIGKSKVSDIDIDFSSILKNEKLIIPQDVVVETPSGETVAKKIEEVNEGDIIWDVGKKSINLLEDRVHEARFVLWNGPIGNYEIGFKDGTLELAKILSRADSDTMIGGGDTLSAILELDLLDRFSFVSTGGGAMLEFLAKEDLTALKAMREGYN